MWPAARPASSESAWTSDSSTPKPSTDERAAIDAFLGPPVSAWAGADRVENGHSAHGGHAARAQRHQLLPTLHALHEQAGWISPGALNYIAQRLTIPPADVYGVATFYALFSVEPRPARVLHVCNDLACRCAGSQQLIDTLTERIGPQGTDNDGATWHAAPCLGQCDRAPAALLVQSGEDPVERELTGVDADGADRDPPRRHAGAAALDRAAPGRSARPSPAAPRRRGRSREPRRLPRPRRL